jgi:predicted nucleic acid-binding protein
MTVVVVDASVLVAEVLRARGRDLLRTPDLAVLVAEAQWNEAQHELARRLDVLASRGLTKGSRRDLENAVQALIDDGAVQVVPPAEYERHRSTALRRVPRDERDWPTVALAIAVDAAILTADNDFLGCGCPTWTVETLAAELRRG